VIVRQSEEDRAADEAFAWQEREADEAEKARRREHEYRMQELLTKRRLEEALVVEEMSLERAKINNRWSRVVVRLAAIWTIGFLSLFKRAVPDEIKNILNT
jgi:hypothetical protein